MKRTRWQSPRKCKRTKPPEHDEFLAQVLFQIIPFLRASDLINLKNTSRFCHQYVGSKIAHWRTSLSKQTFGFWEISCTETQKRYCAVFQLYEAYYRGLIDNEIYGVARREISGLCDECFIATNAHVLFDVRSWKKTIVPSAWLHQGPNLLGLNYNHYGMSPLFSDTFFHNLKSLSFEAQFWLIKRLSTHGITSITNAMDNKLSVKVISSCVAYNPPLLDSHCVPYTQTVVEPEYLEKVVKICMRKASNTRSFMKTCSELANVYDPKRIEHYVELIVRYTSYDKEEQKRFLDAYRGGLNDETLGKICDVVTDRVLHRFLTPSRVFLHPQLRTLLDRRSRIPVGAWLGHVSAALYNDWQSEALQEQICYLFSKKVLIQMIVLVWKMESPDRFLNSEGVTYFRGEFVVGRQHFHALPIEVYDALKPLLPVEKNTVEWHLISGFYTRCMETGRFHQIFDQEGTREERWKIQDAELRQRYPEIKAKNS